MFWSFFARAGRRSQPNRKSHRATVSRKSRLPFAGLEQLEHRTLLTANLAITNTASPATAVTAGEVVQYNLNISSTGADATNTVVTDHLATGETFLRLAVANETSSPNISYNLSTNTVTYNAGTISTVTPVTATVYALVGSSASGTLTDTAAAYSPDDSSHSTAGTAVTSQAQNSVTALGGGASDLAISVSAANNNAAVNPGGTDNVVYTVTVKNNGSNTATGVQVLDYLPASFAGTNSSEPTGVTVTFPSSDVAQATLPDIAAGQSQTFSLTFDGPDTPPGALVNMAVVTDTNGDSNTDNNYAFTVTPVNPAAGSTVDLSVTQRASINPVINQPLTYTLTVTNNSTTTDATNVYVTDLLPPGATFVSGSTSVSGVNVTAQAGSVVSAVFPTLAKGTSATITLTVTPTVTGSITNSAYVESTDDQDAAQTNNANLLNTTVNATSLTAHQLYVSAVYEDVLGRAVDASGLSYWAGLLDGGTAISSVAYSIAHSAEYYQKFVIEPDYLKLLGRAVDATGLTYWTQQMQNGLTDQGLEADLVASDEFYTNAGGTNTAWVDAVYTSLLGRSADANGQQYWTGQLIAGVSRVTVALGIANSTENNTILIDADYQQYLGRAADASGVSYWLSQFAAGQTNEDVIAGFTGSTEFYNANS